MGALLPVSAVPKLRSLVDTGCFTTQCLRIAYLRFDPRRRRAGMRAALSGAMPKSKKRTRRQESDRSATTDIVTQLECAIRRPQATLIGALVGGIVPWFARTLAHDQLPAAWRSGSGALATVLLVVILGCALFSAITVFKFGKATFNDTRKAIGFVAAIEGVMLVSTGSTSDVALAVLVLINALANGSSIALARDATCKRREAAARASATRRSRGKANSAIEVVDETAATSAARASRKPGPVVKARRGSAADDTNVDTTTGIGKASRPLPSRAMVL